MLPHELWEQASARSLDENARNAPSLNRRSLLPGVTPFPPRPLLAGLTGKLWKPGRVLRVVFLDGETRLHERVPGFARQWSSVANIGFDFVSGTDGELRISFRQTGSWSYIGTDALSVPDTQPTMNLGWLTQATKDEEFGRVVLHEFGHALGCIHEHQNPVGGIPWDTQAVYEYYQGPPNYWSKDQIDTNVFQRYDRSQTQFSDLDPHSIMLYPIPNQFTQGDFEIGWNTGLSATDRRYIAALYPHNASRAVQLETDNPPASASIGAHGEIDTFSFAVESPTLYRIETEGSSDVAISLFGPDDDTNPVAQDDNSGLRTNARLIVDLVPGTYCLRVRHASPEGVGDYRIGVHSAR